MGCSTIEKKEYAPKEKVRHGTQRKFEDEFHVQWADYCRQLYWKRKYERDGKK